MAGLLDALFDPQLYSGAGGLLSRLSPSLGQTAQSEGFPHQDQPSPLDTAQWPYGPVGAPSSASSFADRFNALPGAPQPVVGSGRSFDTAQFDPQTFAPNQALPIAVGNYQMPRVGSADQYQPQQALIPPNAQPAQGQMPTSAPQMPAASPQADFQLPPALGGVGSILGRLGSPDGLLARLSGTDSRSIAQQNLKAQYDSLVPALGPQKALLAVMNPAAGKLLLEQALSQKEKFQKTGQDPLTGVEQYGFVNEQNQTINGKPLSAQPTSTNALGDPNLTGDAYLQSLPENLRSQVRAIVEGRMQPPSGFALKSPQIQALMRAAAQYEPGFDLTKWSARAGTAKDFASGAAAKNVTSLNTVIGHLGDLKKAADELDNYSIPLVNEIGNAYHSATGGAKVNNFNLARNAVADELAKVFKGSGISDHEIAQWKGTLNAAQSPEQLKGAVKTAISLMESRLSALNDQRDRGMSTQSEPRSLLNEKSQKALKEVEDWANGTSASKKSGGVDRSAIEAEMRRRGLLK